MLEKMSSKAVVDGVLPGSWVDEATGAWLSIPWPGDPGLPWNCDERLALLPASLGPLVVRFGEENFVHHQTGEPWRYTPGQKRFLYLWYAVNPAGRFVYRSGVKRGAKGTGKDPFGAAFGLTEMCGPVEFAGFDAAGRPMGKPRGLAKVQVAANSLGQAKEIIEVAGELVSPWMREQYSVDVGVTRIISVHGKMELLTSSERSSEGVPATAIILNESHHMTESSGGHAIAATARRNAAKSPSYIQARLLELTNAHQQGMDSVAEKSFTAWQAQQVLEPRFRDILYDSIEAPPTADLFDEGQRLRALRAAYCDAPWADLERYSSEIMDPRTSVADSIRYYLNGLAAAEDAWVDPARFDALAEPGVIVEDGDRVALFLDCSKAEDATALVGCRISDGHVFTLGIWGRPRGPRGEGWLAPREIVDARVREAREKYRVVWFGVDPSPAKDDSEEALYWAGMIEGWHRDFHRSLLVWATPGVQGSSVLFDMRMSERGAAARNKAFTFEAMRTAQDVDKGEWRDPGARPFTHDGNPVLRVHVHNAKRRPNRWGHSLGKVNRDSAGLVDGAVAMVGARLGRKLVLDSGKVSAGGRVRSRRRRGGVLR